MFFSPVFNIADSSIFIGVVTILFSQKRFFTEHLEEATPSSATTTETPTAQNDEVIVTHSENGIEEQPFPNEEFKSPLETPDKEGPAERSA